VRASCFLCLVCNRVGPNTSKIFYAETKSYTIFHYLIYAVINVIIAVPGLYGYSSVIFNNPAFQPHMAALSKLVIFSSFVHQLAFAMFSTLDFAIGTVQDAGLIFLSAMANTIANTIQDNGGTVDEIVSTTLVILPLGTASLGLVLIVLGKFKLLDIVSYLPMPVSMGFYVVLLDVMQYSMLTFMICICNQQVIGGYLAFIGYFCLEAGVALCISRSMMELSDWAYLLDPHSLLLATPGLLSALLLTYISRKATNDAMLPIAMVMIPITFYVVLFICGISLAEARDIGWVGEVSPTVQFGDMLHLVDFNLVHWSLVTKCIGTWVGMVFVVSFASCLDIAAVSMDMGEALDTNKEMVTVGASNLMSGCLFGFTGMVFKRWISDVGCVMLLPHMN
jgi:SulP family sulfate permease